MDTMIRSHSPAAPLPRPRCSFCDCTKTPWVQVKQNDTVVALNYEPPGALSIRIGDGLAMVAEILFCPVCGRKL